jgi:hypothetical protein
MHLKKEMYVMNSIILFKKKFQPRQDNNQQELQLYSTVELWYDQCLVVFSYLLSYHYKGTKERTPIIVSLCDLQEHFSHSNTHPRACGIDPNGSFSQALEVDPHPLQF